VNSELEKATQEIKNALASLETKYGGAIAADDLRREMEDIKDSSSSDESSRGPTLTLSSPLSSATNSLL
jgi:hypothetical protein